MKFSNYTPAVAPNSANPGAVHAQSIPTERPSGSRGYEAMAAAFGQITGMLQKKQDEDDAADVMKARNEIMTSLTGQLYGENGLMTTGVGENAKGLTDRVSQAINETFDKVSKNYNPRVRRALQGNLNENMANYQRLAGQQEGREATKVKDLTYASNLQQSVDLAIANYNDDQILGSTVNDVLRMVDYRAADQGFSPAMRLQERKNVLTSIYGGAIQNAIDNEDMTKADMILSQHGHEMNQTETMKYQRVLRKEQKTIQERDEFDALKKQFTKADGSIDYVAMEQEIERRSREKKWIGGSGGGGSISTIDGLMAAIGGQESGGDYDAENGRTGAHGKYQIMPKNWPSWAEEAGLGADAPRTPENQEAVAKYKLSQYLQQYGPEGAMVAWYSGPANAERWANGESTDIYGRSWDAKNGNGDEPSIREYVQQVSARGGGSGDQTYNMPTQGANIDEQVSALTPQFQAELPTIGGILKNKFGVDPVVSSGGRTREHNAEVGGAEHSDHIIGENGGNAVDIVFDCSDEKAQQILDYFEGTGAFRYVDYHDVGSGYHLHLGGLQKSLSGAGGGGEGHYTNAHDSGWYSRMMTRLKADRADYMSGQEMAKRDKISAYTDQLKGADATTAAAIVAQVKDTEDFDVYHAVLNADKVYHKDTYAETETGRAGETVADKDSSKEETRGGNAADVMAAQLGRGASVSSELLVKVRNYNRLNQEEWDHLHSKEIQGKLADMIDKNDGDLQATYNQLAAEYGERAAAQIIATVDDGYFEK